MLAAIKGAFKIPSLRNVELTGPYMHSGGMKALAGGQLTSTTGAVTLPISIILPPGCPLMASPPQQKADLVAFLCKV
jgi:hypothetical protein